LDGSPLQRMNVLPLIGFSCLGTWGHVKCARLGKELK
jgi:hypothetical protein